MIIKKKFLANVKKYNKKKDKFNEIHYNQQIISEKNYVHYKKNHNND